MKKILFTLAILCMTLTGVMILAQNTAASVDTTNNKAQMDKMDTMDSAKTAGTVQEKKEEKAPEEVSTKPSDNDMVQERSGHQIIKDYFIQGGGFMFPVLVCLIIGLAVCIERIITLNLKTVNSEKLLKEVENHFEKGDVEGAREKVRNTRGPVASLFYQAIDRRHEGIDIVERSIVSYGSVQMGLLEKGLVWISLFIALAPMLGFMGTVIGMIQAFDAIEAAGDISPSLVAGGIKVALLTTVAGLIAAVVLQVFYNYLVSKIDSLVNDMEDSSISLVDLMIKHKVVERKEI